ncbi:MAG: CDP-alcohol phosphatidyltransferase family protein [candidate division WOR-3 bacterium]
MAKVSEYGYLIADYLTSLRFFLVLVLLALIPGRIGNLSPFMLILFTAWLTDILDGYFARVSGREGKLGKYDGVVDSFMYISTFLYSTTLGYFSVKFFLLVLLCNLIMVGVTRNAEVNQAFHFLYIILGLLTLLRLSKVWFNITVAWMICVIFLKRNRLKEQIITFLRSWRNLLFGK